MRAPFIDLVEARWKAKKYLCVGLDPDLEKLPDEIPLNENDGLRVLAFNEVIVERTADVAAAFKPNMAFYEALGSQGLDVLARTVAYIHDVAPEVPVIVDGKRADIDNTNKGYAHALFDEIEADAITVHPYLGGEALGPLLNRKDKGVFVLARTSNKGGGEFQDLPVGTDGDPLYLVVASAVAKNWNQASNCGLVAGATYPEELSRIRAAVGDLPLLIPGVGSQGGAIEKAVRNGWHPRNGRLLVNISRAIIFASREEKFRGVQYADAAQQSANDYHAEILASLPAD